METSLQVFVSALVGIIAYWTQHYLKAYWIKSNITIESEKRVGSSVFFSVANKSMFSIRKGAILVSLDMSAGDIVDFPPRTQIEIDRSANKNPQRAFVEGTHPLIVEDVQICWAFTSKSEINPP